MLSGCYTAIVTPMSGSDADTVDFHALAKLVDFQVACGVKGILAVGTTGESPTLTWEEHGRVITSTFDYSGGRCLVIAGTGSNCTRETIHATKLAFKHGIRAALLTDPYYNGPSSLEIRREYVEPVAAQFPDVQMILYTIPGRTGTQILPQDIALLHRKYPNVAAVKEATGDVENMRLLRRTCGGSLTILSGDDDMTYSMMTDPAIKAAGVISVVSNVAPTACQNMCAAVLKGDTHSADRLRAALEPLFKLVTVKTEEQTPFGPVLCRARNPVPLKTLMNLLGMPAGPCRRPLGKMTAQGFQRVLDGARKVWTDTPELFRPIEQAFGVSIESRLKDQNLARALVYEGDPYAES